MHSHSITNASLCKRQPRQNGGPLASMVKARPLRKQNKSERALLGQVPGEKGY